MEVYSTAVYCINQVEFDLHFFIILTNKKTIQIFLSYSFEKYETKVAFFQILRRPAKKM